MAVTLDNLLHQVTITRVVSEMKTTSSRFQDAYGLGVGGMVTERRSGKSFAWDIFNDTRKMAQGRVPNSGPGSASRQRVGQASGSAHRLHEKIPITFDDLLQRRAIGMPLGTLDRFGVSYVARQAQYMAQRISNAREFMISRLLCGGTFALNPFGESRVLSDTVATGGFATDFRFQLGNTGTVDGPGGDGTTAGVFTAANWSVVTYDILSDLYGINALSASDSGYAIRHLWITSKIWGYMQVNESLRFAAGSANRVWEDLTPVASTGRNSGDTGFTARLTAVPWLTIHIMDEVLDVDPTGTENRTMSATTQVPVLKGGNGTNAAGAGAKVLFTPNMGEDWIGFIEGSEVIVENAAASPREVFGFATWAEPTTQPGGKDLITLDVGLPVLYVPSAVYYPTVIPA